MKLFSDLPIGTKFNSVGGKTTYLKVSKDGAVTSDTPLPATPRNTYPFHPTEEVVEVP